MQNPPTSPWRSITNTIYSSINKTPERLHSSQDFGAVSPIPATFKFTPTKGKKLYPHLNPPDSQQSHILTSSPTHTPLSDNNDSYMVKENSSFVFAMDTLQRQLFSSNISTKVLNDFSARYENLREQSIANVVEQNQSTSNEDLNRRASGRFSSSHRGRFNRMESIAFHYAAKRNENQTQKSNKETESSHQQRKLVPPVNSVSEMKENENLLLLTPGDKRFHSKGLESASKRLRLSEVKYKEIDSSPTKTHIERENLKTMYEDHIQQVVPQPLQYSPQRLERPQQHQQQHHQPSHHDSQNQNHLPSYLQPTKASLQRSASSTSSISPSKSSRSLHKSLGNNIPDLQPTSPKKVDHTHPKLSRSPSISPSHKPLGLRKISPSKAFSNLNEILTSSPEKMSPEKSPMEDHDFAVPSTTSRHLTSTTKSHLPRSRTANTVLESSISRSTSSLSHYQSQPHSNSRSQTLPTSKSARSLSSSSSIPRLATLTRVESRVKQVSKHGDSGLNGDAPKKWRY